MANKSMLYILVMKIMLINTQGMYIFPQYLFFSQLPKIKIAFNSYIYKYSDSSLYGFDEGGEYKSFNDLAFQSLSSVPALHMHLPGSRCNVIML